MASTFSKIPIVDLALSEEEIARSIGEACRDVGFFYIKNHGVPASLVEKTMKASEAFFAAPKSEKVNITWDKSTSGTRGFFGLREEDLNGVDSTRQLDREIGIDMSKRKGDLKESFDFGRELAPEEFNAAFPLVAANMWLDEDKVPGFKNTVLQYQNEMLSVAKVILKAFADSLGLPSDYFLSRSRNPMVTTRLLHYPPASDSKSGEEVPGAGAHTDYGCCTILAQDSAGGLEVRNAAGEWVEAVPIPDTFVVNIGDMMSRWTRGLYCSTIHRVRNTKSMGRDRYSIPFFFNPSPETVVSPLSLEGVSKKVLEHRRLWEAPTMTAHDILHERYLRSVSHKVSQLPFSGAQANPACRSLSAA